MDALLGSVAFVYVFLLGRWQGGAVGGLAAVLVLYTLAPLVFEHGLRSNNMEAMLLTCYAGGIYHFCRWADGARSAARHRWPTALYFTAGFLTKFVAILFLPLICAAALVLRVEGRPARWWRAWIAPAVLVVALSAPWFIYQTVASGALFWDVLLWQHVYRRFTGALDVHHLQPWDYYVSTLWLQLRAAGSAWLSVAGAVALAASAVRRGGWLARVFLFWGIVPIVLLSFGSSKLFHYIYPFLPPVALAAGYAASLAYRATLHLFDSFVIPAVRWVVPRTLVARRPAMRAGGRLLIGLAAAAALVGVATVVLGEVHWDIAGARVVRNASLTRPFLLAALLVCVAGQLRWTARLIAIAILMTILPASAYAHSLRRSTVIDRPLHAARQCVDQVRRSGAAVGVTVYDTAASRTNHPYNFYLRDFEPWLRADAPDPGELRRRLSEPGHQTPVITTRADYVDAALPIVDAAEGQHAPLVGFSADPDLIVLLPASYAECAATAARAGGRPVGFIAPRSPS
jgi:4-amino-4-deoxy-L-arabinose transferase-like glycosyltransferase